MYLDVDGDLYHSPLDVLVLINFINSGARFQIPNPEPNGEGEPSLFSDNIVMAFARADYFASSNENIRKQVISRPVTSIRRGETIAPAIVQASPRRRSESFLDGELRHSEIEAIVDEMETGLDEDILELLTKNFHSLQ